MTEKKSLLSSLKPSSGSSKRRRRIGRGIGSGVGKTCGRGHKGQQSRSGASIPAWFEGGAMPLYRRIPKVGFRSLQNITGKNRYNLINLGTLEYLFEDGAEVTIETLREQGYGTKQRNKAGLKVLAYGDITKKLNLKVSAISKAAQQKIEQAGGSVELV